MLLLDVCCPTLFNVNYYNHVIQALIIIEIVYVNCFAKSLRKLHIKKGTLSTLHVIQNESSAMRVTGPSCLAL